MSEWVESERNEKHTITIFTHSHFWVNIEKCWASTIQNERYGKSRGPKRNKIKNHTKWHIWIPQSGSSLSLRTCIYLFNLTIFIINSSIMFRKFEQTTVTKFVIPFGSRFYIDLMIFFTAFVFHFLFLWSRKIQSIE